MRRITHPTMYNSAYGRLLRSLLVTADSSLPATTKTKSSNHFIPVAQWLNSESKEKKEQKLPTVSSLDFEKSSTEKEFNTKTKVLIELISKHFPDWRRVLNECQRYSVGGSIDSGILASFGDVAVNDLVKNLKEKNFPEVRKWIVSNLDNDPNVLLRRAYDALYEVLDGPSIAAAVLIVAKYQYQSAFVADQRLINLLAANDRNYEDATPYYAKELI